MFFSSLKNYFYLAQQLLNKSQQIAVYRDPWTAFLDRSYCIFDPSKYFGICLDNFLIDSRSIEIFCSRQILDNTSTNICQELVLDKFLIALDPSRHNFYKQIQHNFRSHFLQSLSTDLRPFSSQTFFSLSKPQTRLIFSLE